jgi:hypothetical protein
MNVHVSKMLSASLVEVTKDNKIAIREETARELKEFFESI